MAPCLARNAAEAIGFGGKLVAVRQAKIRRCTPYQNPARTMLGFISVEMPSGVIYHGLRLMVGPKGERWIAMPSVKQLDQDGNPAKPIWNPIIEFANRASYDKFQTMVLEALRRAHPKAFD
jgi:DNA-binding cell septation regulator SpoVG